MQAPTPCVATNTTANQHDKTMRYFKESEWRDEVEYLKEQDIPCPEPLASLNNSLNITRVTTRGAVLYFYFSLPEELQRDRHNIFSAHRQLRAIRKERRRQTIMKWRKWCSAIKAKIYRWQLKREYKRITKHDQNK